MGCASFLLFVSVSGILTTGIFLISFADYFQVRLRGTARVEGQSALNNACAMFVVVFFVGGEIFTSQGLPVFPGGLPEV